MMSAAFLFGRELVEEDDKEEGVDSIGSVG